MIYFPKSEDWFHEKSQQGFSGKKKNQTPAQDKHLSEEEYYFSDSLSRNVGHVL